MIFSLVLSIAIAFLFGYLLIWHVWPVPDRPVLLIAMLALPAGWSLTSICYFFWLILSGGRGSWYPGIEIVFLIVFLVMGLRYYRSTKAPHFVWMPKDRLKALTSLGFLCVTVVLFAVAAIRASVNPWGRWDAWARINVKARFLFEGGDHWTWIFESRQIAHSDYPLLISSTVARTWTWMGDIYLLGPQTISLLWGIWSVAILYSLVSWLRGPVVAIVVGLASLTYAPLLFWSSAQYSDIPLICYMIAACAMLIAAQRHKGGAKKFLLLAGFFAASAAWCKNEGIVFLGLILLWGFILALRGVVAERGKAAVWFLGGGSLPVGAILVLKLGYAGNSDVVAGRLSSMQSVYALLLDAERHKVILDELHFYAGVFWNWWALLILCVIFILFHVWNRHRIAYCGPLLCVVTLSAIYYLILVTTQYDIRWHVSTSLDRLVLQLWPVLLFSLAVLFKEKDMGENV